MKRMRFLLWGFIISLSVLTGCEFVDFDPEIPDEEFVEVESKVILKSANGFNSTLGVIYVQQNVGIGLKVEGKTSVVESASWKIENSNYEGVQVTHKFASLGEVQVTINAQFADGSSETRTFTIVSVFDISEADPVRAFSYNNNDGTWTVLFLFSKERIRYATDSVFYYNGTVSDWKQQIIPTSDHNYIIDQNGNPQITQDVGKFIGVKVKLVARGSYNIALIHSGDNWTDFSGSAFVQDNPGLVLFWFDGGEIIPKGNAYANNFPGATGDNYFRFTQIGDKVSGKAILFFRLESDYTANAFVVREKNDGGYTNPIAMWPVNDFSDWGQIELPISELADKVCGFRYGPNKNNPEIYSGNMKKSFFYDTFFKNLRLSIYKV